MSKSAFRWLVIVSFAIPTLCLIADATIFAHLIPSDLKAAMDRHIVQETSSASWAMLALFAGAIVVLLAVPFLIFGLLRFRPWAPKFAIWLSVASYALMPFFGASVYSGLTSTALSLGSMLWGIVVVLPYVSPQVRSHFWPDRHTTDSPSATAA